MIGFFILIQIINGQQANKISITNDFTIKMGLEDEEGIFQVKLLEETDLVNLVLSELYKEKLPNNQLATDMNYHHFTTDGKCKSRHWARKIKINEIKYQLFQTEIYVLTEPNDCDELYNKYFITIPPKHDGVFSLKKLTSYLGSNNKIWSIHIKSGSKDKSLLTLKDLDVENCQSNYTWINSSIPDELIFGVKNFFIPDSEFNYKNNLKVKILMDYDKPFKMPNEFKYYIGELLEAKWNAKTEFYEVNCDMKKTELKFVIEIIQNEFNLEIPFSRFIANNKNNINECYLNIIDTREDEPIEISAHIFQDYCVAKDYEHSIRPNTYNEYDTFIGFSNLKYPNNDINEENLQIMMLTRWKIQIMILTKWNIQIMILRRRNLQIMLLTRWKIQITILSRRNLQIMILTRWNIQIMILTRWNIQIMILTKMKL